MLRAPRAMQTADGWIVLAPTTGQQIKRAMVAAGLEDKLPDLRSQPDPIATSQLFFELLAPRLGDRTTAEWSAVFAEADVPASAVMTKAEHVEDEQVMHNAIYRTVPDPTLGMAPVTSARRSRRNS